MGSKHALSNGKEPEELTDLLAAFEAQNNCKITLTACVALTKGYLDTRWDAQAISTKVGELEPLPWVLASVSVWAGEYKTLMGVVSRLLYALDFQLALNELDYAHTKKA